jgi:hypothetical protein
VILILFLSGSPPFFFEMDKKKYLQTMSLDRHSVADLGSNPAKGWVGCSLKKYFYFFFNLFWKWWRTYVI